MSFEDDGEGDQGLDLGPMAWLSLGASWVMSLMSLVRLVTRMRGTVRGMAWCRALVTPLTCRAELGAEQQLLRLRS